MYFFVKINSFSNILKENKKKLVKKNRGFVDSEFVKTCHEHVTRCEVDMENPWSFDGPEVSNCKGCKISWFKGKNATLRPVRKLKDGQIVTKWAKRNSFFNFFTPPKMTR